MGNKRSVEGDKMIDAYINDARLAGEEMLRKEYRGLGDTIEAAAHRVQKKWGAPASFLMRLRHRSGLKDMMLSSFVAVAEAYGKFSRTAERGYENERKQHDPNSKMARLAAVIAGAKTQTSQTQVD